MQGGCDADRGRLGTDRGAGTGDPHLLRAEQLGAAACFKALRRSDDSFATVHEFLASVGRTTIAWDQRKVSRLELLFGDMKAALDTGMPPDQVIANLDAALALRASSSTTVGRHSRRHVRGRRRGRVQLHGRRQLRRRRQ
jgi:hypothetical protein